MSDKTEITPDESLLYAAQKAVADAIYAEMKDNKAAFTDGMLAERERGNKQKVAELPGGEVVATHTVSQPSRKTQIMDDDAFTEWLLEHHPDQVEEITTYRVKAGAVPMVQESTTVGGDGHHYDQDGDEVPGIKTYTPPASSFSTRFTKEGKERLLEALWSGELAELTGTHQTVLRQIGGRA